MDDRKKISPSIRDIPENTLVHVALSGGVDSAVAALILKNAGFKTVGVFMKNWSGEEFGIQETCPWKDDQDSAAAVCHHLDIPFKTYNFEREYREYVLTYFIDEYSRGFTPNPDIVCNEKIKFGLFLAKSLSEGASYIATGHYAQLSYSKDHGHTLQQAVDTEKDQTYFLYRLSNEQLSHTLFPIGHLTKQKVREIAYSHSLPNATRKDSQGICFVGKIDVATLLKKYVPHQQGDIIDIDTKKQVGTHDGVTLFTHGQRDGLRMSGAPKAYYVCDKNLTTNTLYVASGRNNPALYTTCVKLRDTHWQILPSLSMKRTAMVRYRQKPVSCDYCHETKTITFEKPVWKPSPGQSAVLIAHKKIIGGGIIIS